MNSFPSVSDAEWQIMRILWADSPLTANQIIDRLEGQKNWKPKTVKTLITRLVKKKVVSYDIDHRTFLYYPLIKEEECIAAENQSFIKRVYNGAVNVMLANFIQNQSLSKDDIEELKKILEKKEQ